jgi:hypothetical protein
VYSVRRDQRYTDRLTFQRPHPRIDGMKSKKLGGKSGGGSVLFGRGGIFQITKLAGAGLCLFWMALVCTAGQQKTGTLKGKTVDEKGKAIPGCTIRLTDTRDRSIKEVQTDASGNFSIELPPDEYLVSFQAEGFQEASLQALQQIEVGKETRIKPITLPKASKISLVRGSVFNLNGQTMGGVKVTLVRIRTEDEEKEGKKVKSHTKNYVTNAHGEFAFRLPAEPARYRVTGTARGYKSDSKVVDVSGSESVPVALTLLPQKPKG